MQELRPGLWTWTAPHPEWVKGEGWGPHVGSYACRAGASLVLFDPLDPPRALDELAAGSAVDVLLTAEWHGRSTDECVSRLGARVPEAPPAGVERRPTYDDEEVAYWIPQHAALVVGDAFGAEGRPLHMQETWLPPDVTREQMSEGLRPLLELPVELVLVTHGDPVTENAREALRAALEA